MYIVNAREWCHWGCPRSKPWLTLCGCSPIRCACRAWACTRWSVSDIPQCLFLAETDNLLCPVCAVISNGLNLTLKCSPLVQWITLGAFNQCVGDAPSFTWKKSTILMLACYTRWSQNSTISTILHYCFDHLILLQPVRKKMSMTKRVHNLTTSKSFKCPNHRKRLGACWAPSFLKSSITNP